MKNVNFLRAFYRLFVIGFLISGQLFAQNTFYKTYDGSGNDVGSYVATTADGGYVIVGKTNSFGAGGYDVWLLKTNASGDTLWTKTYGGISDDEGRCVQQTADGGYIIAANTTIPGHYNDGWVFKTDANGLIEWDYTFGNELNMDGASFVLDDDEGNFIVTGTVNGKSHVFKIDGSGNIIWEETYFSNNSSATTSICPIANNRYAVVGTFQNVSGGWWYPNMFIIENTGELVTQLTWLQYESGAINFVTPSSDQGMLFGGAWTEAPALMRLSYSGMDVWEYIYPQTGLYNYMNSAVLNDDGSFVVVGNWESGAMLEINDSGDTLWTRSGTLNNEDIYYSSIQNTFDNSLILTGYGKPSANDHQVILVKTLENGGMSGIIQNGNWKRNSSIMQNNPNPFTDNTTLSFNLVKNEYVKIFITDINGKLIRTIIEGNMNVGEHQIVWNGMNNNGLQSDDGIYFAVMKLRSGLCQTVKMIKTRAY